MSRGELTQGEVAGMAYRAIAQAAENGWRAPTNDEMAAMFEVAPSTVWKAIGILVAGKLIERRKVQRPRRNRITIGGHESVYRIVSTGAETLGFSTMPPVAPPMPKAQRTETTRVLQAAE